MKPNLFRIGTFEFYPQHLLIILVLSISFSISILIRLQPADFGFQLNEYDPFFNYRATQFIVENGIHDYFSWHDDMSWYPAGRDIAATSQTMLHITAAILYQIFGKGITLYDFTIILPVVFGSLTTVVMFVLVRVLAGTTAGLFASMLYSIALPIMMRGTIGWFKSEPLGLFLGLVSLYFFLSGIKSNKFKVSILKLTVGGLFLGLAFSAWGGTQFFILSLGIFLIILPFMRSNNRLFYTIPAFIFGFTLSLLPFEKPGIQFFTTVSGFLFLGSTIFFISCSFIQKLNEQKRNRNTMLFLIAAIVVGMGILSTNMFGMPSFRYLNVLNPFLTVDPLVDSIVEHAAVSMRSSFLFHSVFMIFGGFGAWLIFGNITNADNQRRDVHAFALIFGLLAVYIGSVFIRLEVFSSLGLVMLGAIGLGMLTKEIFKSEQRENKKSIKAHPRSLKISYSTIIIILLIIPMMFPAGANWVTGAKSPPTILNGGSIFLTATNDWLETLEWMKSNTPKDAIIAAWWDYGYWITTIGERKTLADNATLISELIEALGKIFMSPMPQGLEISNKYNVDYIVVYFSGYKIVTSSNEYFTLLDGDVSKIKNIAKVTKVNSTNLIFNDQVTPSDHFWDETFLGKLIPLKRIGYFDSNKDITNIPQPGNTAAYVKSTKLIDDDGIKLVYSSSSFNRNSTGFVSVVLVYEIN